MGAYLVLGGVVTFWLTNALGGDLLEGLPESFAVSSFLVTALLYIRPDGWLNYWLMQYLDTRKQFKLHLPLSGIAGLPYLQKPKDELWGRFIFTLDILLLCLLIERFPTYFDDYPLPQTVIAIVALLLAFSIGLSSGKYLHNYHRKLDMVWRFFTLHTSRPANESQQEQVRQIETYLSLGVWDLAENQLRDIDRKILPILTEIKEFLPEVEPYLKWGLNPTGQTPAVPPRTLTEQLSLLRGLGFKYVETESVPSLLTVLEGIAKVIEDFEAARRGAARPTDLQIAEAMKVQFEDAYASLKRLEERLEVEEQSSTYKFPYRPQEIWHRRQVMRIKRRLPF